MTSVGVQMLVANYPPHGGGSERQCALLARELVKRGDRIGVVTRQLDAAPLGEGVPVCQIAAPVSHRVARAAVFSAGAFRELLRRRRGYDIVHCHGFEALGLVGVAARFFAGKRLVVKVVTSGSYGDAARLKGMAGGAWVARALARADAVVVLNEEARAEMLGLGVEAQRITLVPNGVEIPAAPSTQRGPDFLFCGRLVPQKNVDGLLRAWAKTSAARSRRLQIVGEGPMRATLEALAAELGIRESVVFGDHIADARPAIARAHAVVLFSHAEGLSNFVLEAMAASTPVIASDIAGNADLVRHETTGLLVAPGDEAALAAAIDRLADDEQLRARLGSQARALVGDLYDIAKVAERVHTLYERVLGGRSAP